MMRKLGKILAISVMILMAPNGFMGEKEKIDECEELTFVDWGGYLEPFFDRSKIITVGSNGRDTLFAGGNGTLVRYDGDQWYDLTDEVSEGDGCIMWYDVEWNGEYWLLLGGRVDSTNLKFSPKIWRIDADLKEFTPLHLDLPSKYFPKVALTAAWNSVDEYWLIGGQDFSTIDATGWKMGGALVKYDGKAFLDVRDQLVSTNPLDFFTGRRWFAGGVFAIGYNPTYNSFLIGGGSPNFDITRLSYAKSEWVGDFNKKFLYISQNTNRHGKPWETFLWKGAAIGHQAITWNPVDEYWLIGGWYGMLNMATEEQVSTHSSFTDLSDLLTNFSRKGRKSDVSGILWDPENNGFLISGGDFDFKYNMKKRSYGSLNFAYSHTILSNSPFTDLSDKLIKWDLAREGIHYMAFNNDINSPAFYIVGGENMRGPKVNYGMVNKWPDQIDP